MQSFLEKTVKYLYEKYGEDISDLCIVLPNRRAGLFLKTHFSNQFKRTFWSPEIYGTEDFIALLAQLEIADTTTLLFELYETVKAVGQTDIESFDEFSKWGQILLSDLNEIDRYLVDASKLFGNLKDIKELETWSLNSEEGLTDFQKQYLQFWKLLGTYYHHFKERLLLKKQAYQGLAYRVVAEKLEERIQHHSWKRIIFIGFNALNKAEEKIIEQLLDTDRAEIIWDTDTYYVNNLSQEAGRFIRKYNQFGNFKKLKERNIVFEEELLSKEKKHIHIIGVPKNVAQAKVAGNLVNEISTIDKRLQNTALVLADENLLFPVLHSLPIHLQDINVTMGYPLKNTSFSGYVDLIFNLHEMGLKLNQGKTNYSFYHTDLVKFFNHPYTYTLLSELKKPSFAKEVLTHIQNKNIVFANISTLQKVAEKHSAEKEFELLRPIFNHWQLPSDAIGCMHYLIETLKNAIVDQQTKQEENKASLELEYLFAFTKITKRIEVLMQEYPQSIVDLKTLRSILNQIVRSATLPFYGEPLMGLQVMGMLETRTLDFENVVLLSCNEDILPSAKTVNSFIPFELKKYFSLPVNSDKDAIFAYHFYRLLQRAKNIYLLYNTESDVFVSGEKSRYLTQLIYELPKVNPNVIIKEQLLNIPILTKPLFNTITVSKTSSVLEKLKERADYGFSPSVLNVYRNCSLQFYFSAVAGLKEVSEVEETIGADTLGNVIHKVLELFYKPYIGKKITIADIQEMKKKVEQSTISAFEEEYSKTEISVGKNLLILKVALKFINNFLDAEIQMIAKAEKNHQPVIVKHLEQEYSAKLEIDSHNITIKGKSDRVDAVGKTIRIVDYKTGIVEDKELKLDDWDDIRTSSVYAKSFQLLTYAWMFQKTNPAITDNILSGIVTFRQLSAGLKTVKVNKSDVLNVAVLNEFELQLKQLLNDIFNPEIPFEQTSELDNCVYCAFRGICNR